MKRYFAAIVVAGACVTGLSTDAVAQSNPPPTYNYLHMVHPQGVMCDGPHGM